MITYIVILFLAWLFFGWSVFLYIGIGMVVLYLLMDKFPNWFDL